MKKCLVTLGSVVLALSAVLSSGCTFSTGNNNNSGTNNNTGGANNTGTSGSPSPSAPSAPKSSGTSTPTETFKTFYSAVANKDIAALKSVLPKKIVDDIAAEATKKNKPLDDFYRDEVLPDLARGITESSMETRNEKIDGDRATLEFMSKGEWKTARFAKEGDSWRLDM